jgi:hypothetical protein
VSQTAQNETFYAVMFAIVKVKTEKRPELECSFSRRPHSEVFSDTEISGLASCREGVTYRDLAGIRKIGTRKKRDALTQKSVLVERHLGNKRGKRDLPLTRLIPANILPSGLCLRTCCLSLGCLAVPMRAPTRINGILSKLP